MAHRLRVRAPQETFEQVLERLRGFVECENHDVERDCYAIPVWWIREAIKRLEERIK